MKNLNYIFVLSSILVAIVFVWLIPKTKGEHKTQYVRVYTEEEDTTKNKSTEKRMEEKKEVNKINKPQPEKIKSTRRKVVQIDTLNGNFKMKDLKMSLYSRSMHFEPIEEIRLTDLPEETKADSTVIVAQ